MSGTPVSNFSDFWTTTGPLLFAGPDEIINDAAARTWTLKHFLKGKKFADVAQGGKRIEDYLFLDDASTFEFYHPGATGTPTQPQVMSQIYQNWRWGRDSKAWQDEIMRLQSNGSTTKARFQTYKRQAKTLEMRLWTSILGGMERQLWANPHGSATAAEMETETGSQPASIPALITEDTTNYHPNGWSTIHGLDPAIKDKWRNPVTRYNILDPLDTAGTISGLFDALELMWMLLSWQKPGKSDENFTESTPNKGALFCSRSGKLFYQNLCRASNDNFMRAHNDPSYPGVNFHGAPLEDVEALETAQLYLHSTTTAVTENDDNLTEGGAWSATNWTRGPRFWFVNPEFLKIVFHDTMFFDKTPPKDHVNQPWANVVWMRVCYNLFTNSRQRAGGVVSPGGTAYGE